VKARTLAVDAGRWLTRHRQWGATSARVVLGGVWIYAGVSKISDLPASVRAVEAYELLPLGLAEFVGAALPFVEITIGLFLIAGFATRLNAVVSTVLLTAFVIGIASAWARGLRIDCGCFGGGGELGEGESPSYGVDLARDLGLLLLAGLLAWWPASRLSADEWTAHLVTPAPPRSRAGFVPASPRK